MAITLQQIVDTDSLHDGELKHNSNNSAIETQVNQNETDIATNTGNISGLQTNKLDASTVGAANGIASLDATTKVPLAELPTATSGSQSPNTLPLLDSSGALGITRTLAGSNRTQISLTATDGKSFQLITRTDSSLALYNATDSNNVLLLGPGASSIRDGNDRDIAASGSNSNGYWVRYYDGTQICWYYADLVFDSGFGGRLVLSDSGSAWTFPATFNSSLVPSVSMIAEASTTANNGNRQYYTTNIYSIDYYAAHYPGVYSAQSGLFSTGNTGKAVLMAVGRWL